jgi:hypothetical protein
MSEAEVTGAHDPLKTVADALESAVQAAKDGATHAREAAADLLPESGSLLSRIAYNTCYAISYGVVFPSVLIAQSVPHNNAFVHGLIDGAHAAKDMVAELKTKGEGGVHTTV